MASGAARVRAGDRRDEDASGDATPRASPTRRRCTASARCIDPPPDKVPQPVPAQLLVLPALAPLVPALLRADRAVDHRRARRRRKFVAARTSPRRGPCPTGTTPSRASTSSRSSSRPPTSCGTASRTPSSIRAVTPASTQRIAAVDPRVSVPGPGGAAPAVHHRRLDDVRDVRWHRRPGWQHFRGAGATAGGVEGTPHNVVHGFVGGNMLDFATAGLDPDLLAAPLQHRSLLGGAWPRLRSRRGGRPRASTSGTPAKKSRYRVTAAGCVDPVGQLGYRYDDTDEPASPTRGLDVRRSRRAAMAEQEEPDDLEPEVVGTSDPVELQGATVATAVAVNDVSAQFRTTRGGNAEPRRVYLTVDDITRLRQPGDQLRRVRRGCRRRAASPAPSRSSGSRARSEVGTGSPTRSTSPTSSPPSATTARGTRRTSPCRSSRSGRGPTTDRRGGRAEDVAPVTVGSVSIAYQ